MIFLFGFIDGFYQVTVITQAFVGAAGAISMAILFVYASINAHVRLHTYANVKDYFILYFIIIDSICKYGFHLMIECVRIFVYACAVVVTYYTIYVLSMATASRRRDFSVYLSFFLTHSYMYAFLSNNQIKSKRHFLLLP